MNFNDYIGDKSTKKDGGGSLSPEMKERFLHFFSSYEGKSEDELMNAIFKLAKDSRKQGKLSDAEIEGFVKTLEPMLNASQKEKLKKL